MNRTIDILIGILLIVLVVLFLYVKDSNNTINDIYAILDVTATCEDLTQ